MYTVHILVRVNMCDAGSELIESEHFNPRVLKRCHPRDERG